MCFEAVISSPSKIKSVIKQTKETSNVHPMCRDLSPRRKLGPAIFHKSVSQDRLIEELQDRLGISKPEQEEWRRQDSWLTEGVIIISRPPKKQQDGVQQVEKVESNTWCTCACFWPLHPLEESPIWDDEIGLEGICMVPARLLISER